MGSGDVWIATVSNAPMIRPAKCVSLSSSQFSGEDESVSVEKSNHASSQAVSKVFIQLQIITVYHYL